MKFSHRRGSKKMVFVLELDEKESQREHDLLARIAVEYRRENAADFRLEAADEEKHLTLNDMPEKVDRLIFQPLFSVGAQIEVPVRFSLARPPGAEVACIAFRVADSVFNFPISPRDFLESKRQESEIFQMLCQRDGEEEIATQRAVLWLDDNEYRQIERARIIDEMKKRAARTPWENTKLSQKVKTRDLTFKDFADETGLTTKDLGAAARKNHKFFPHRESHEWRFDETQGQTFYNLLSARVKRGPGRPKKIN